MRIEFLKKDSITGAWYIRIGMTMEELPKWVSLLKNLSPEFIFSTLSFYQKDNISWDTSLTEEETRRWHKFFIEHRNSEELITVEPLTIS